MNLLEARSTPGRDVGKQGRQNERDLLKPREERDEDPAGAGHGHGAATACLSKQRSRHSDAQFGLSTALVPGL